MNRIFCISKRNVKCAFLTFINKETLLFCKLYQFFFCFFAGAVRQKNAELITTVSTKHRMIWKKLPHAFRENLQCLIPGSMSVNIVNQFKIINIKLYTDTVLFGILFHIYCHMLIKTVTVINTCQGIRQRKFS